MQHFFLLIALLGIAPAISAQSDACLETYDQQSIYLRNEFFKGTVFVKNGVSRPVGFAYKNLKPEFELTPAALPLYKKARRNAQWTNGVNLIGLVGVGTGTFLSLSSIDKQGYLTNERRYKTGLNVILVSALFSAGIQIPLSLKSRQQLDDAVWLHNRELLGR